jgi:hypothetical protein
MFLQVQHIPEWLGATIIGAVISVLGYLCKSFFELLEKRKEDNKKKFASLIELCSLLNASYDIFRKQNELVIRLCDQVGKLSKLPFDTGVGL